MIKLKRLLVQSLFGLLLLLIWIYYVDLSDLFQNLREVNFFILPVAFILLLIAYAVRCLKWGILLESLAKVPYTKLLPIYLVGTSLNYIIPVRAGEVAKSLLLKKKHDLSVSKTLPTIFVDKVFDLLGFILAVLIPSILVYPLNPLFTKLIWLSLIVLALMVFAILLSIWKADITRSTVKKIIEPLLPNKYRDSLERALKNFLEGLSVARQSPLNLIKLVLLSVIAVGFDGLFCLSFFYAVGYPTPYLKALMGYGLYALAFILPMTPLQVGSAEVLLTLVFTGLLSLSKTKVNAFIIYGHVMTLLMMFVILYSSLTVVLREKTREILKEV